MSAVTAVPGQEPGHDGPPTPLAPATTAVEFHYTQTDSFAALLNQLGASLLVTTYQANKLLVVRAAGAGLSTLVRTFDKPMGLAVESRRLALGTRNQIWFLRNAPDIAPRIEPAGAHDACYLPRSCHVTGDIAVHELAWANDELWIVNTRFSCLCTLDPDYSFVPRWRPPFITALAAEDRCHLNGLAMGTRSDPIHGVGPGSGRMSAVPTNNLQPKYVTALGATDTPGSWRPDKTRGGCLIDVASGEVVVRGLCMPHSPRLHGGRLWVLESGTGRLLLVDVAAGRCQPVAELSGYLRGLALVGPYAFIGLSKFRESSTFGGLPLSERLAELKCGVEVVDLRSGRSVASLEFQTAVEEIFDLQILAGPRFPEVLGFQKETLHHTFIVPPCHTSLPPW